MMQELLPWLSKASHCLQRSCMYMQHIFWLIFPQVWCGLRCPTAQLDDAEDEDYEDVGGGEEGRRVSRPGRERDGSERNSSLA